MNKPLIAGVLILLLLVAAGVYFFTQPEVVSADLVVEGDYDAPNLALTDGAKLLVTGNLLVDHGKTVACANGPLTIHVTGVATVNGTLQCNGDKSAIHVVAEGGLVMAKSAVVESSGNVQFVSKESELLTTEEAVNAKFDEIGKDSGQGIRVGPLVSGVPAVLNGAGSVAFHSGAFSRLVPTAHAAGPVVIAGKMTVATPPPGIKRLVIFAFPEAVEVSIADFELAGPDGRKGEDDKGANCSAKGKDGEDAFRFTAQAPNLTVNNFTLKLGSGGAGGDAESKADCDPARAEGGKGGDSGNFKMIGSTSFSIEGAFDIIPGDSGAGGGAKAVGKNGDPNMKGADATAVGGRGADNKKVMRMQGTVAGAANIRVGDIVAGPGGWASATGGNGGNADACGKAGGAGGKGSATGGRGGDAKVTLGGGATRMELAGDIGGAGGGVDSSGGAGGNGGSCGGDKTGGNGGAGGPAFATEGKGGSGLHGNASDGANLAEDGGNGGNGGDGCREGKGGAGGTGDPKGTDGADGKNMCVAEKPKTEIQIGGGGTGETGASEKIKVIRHQGDYIPVTQLRIGTHADGAGCPESHWHADQPVTGLSGKTYNDPNPTACGFGMLSENPAFDHSR